MMKKILSLLVAILLSAMLMADRTPSYERYISQYSEIAVSEMARSGVPASITLAQGLLESGAGRSELASRGNNHFGIKCHKDWKGRSMKVDDDKKGECFRVYKSAEESFRDHSDFIRYRDRYKSLFDLEPTDYKGWAQGLKAAGYATDPAYATKLIRIIEEYELYRFDTGEMVESLPEPPARMEEEQIVRVEQEAATPTVKYDETISFSVKREVYSNNGVKFVYAQTGDTYASIAKHYNLFLKELLGFNDLKKDEDLVPGTVVFIQQKKAQAAKGLIKYIVGRDGESLRDICQRFAVKESSIRKMNSLSKDVALRDGDTIVLRKEAVEKKK